MKSKRYICISILVLMLALLCGCDSKNEKNSEKKENSNETEVEKSTYGVNQVDYTELRSDIANIESENITEARIYGGNDVYRTHDTEVIKELIQLISELKLTEISEEEATKEVIYGSYNLYLLSDTKVLYRFNSNGTVLAIGDKFYVEDEEDKQFDRTVISYCRKTFWN